VVIHRRDCPLSRHARTDYLGHQTARLSLFDESHSCAHRCVFFGVLIGYLYHFHPEATKRVLRPTRTRLLMARHFHSFSLDLLLL
jgi:hypothetical protein